MRYTVYAIQSQEDNSIYVGFSNDFNRRLYEHSIGKTKTTKSKLPYKLIYKEIVDTRIKAREREKYLKSGSGKEFLKSLT